MSHRTEPAPPETPLGEFSGKVVQRRCPACGRITMQERCPDCGQVVPNPAREGWICPRCGASNAPRSASCANPECAAPIRWRQRRPH